MSWLLRHLLTMAVFLLLTVAVTASAAGLVNYHLNTETDWSPLTIVIINLSLWTSWFSVFFWELRSLNNGE